MTAIQLEELLTTKEVAALLKCSVHTIYRKDDLPYYMLGKDRRYHKPDITSWLLNQRKSIKCPANRTGFTTSNKRLERKNAASIYTSISMRKAKRSVARQG